MNLGQVQVHKYLVCDLRIIGTELLYQYLRQNHLMRPLSKVETRHGCLTHHCD